ncbi:cytochrome b-245 heavy chain-like [Bolinopsis microptera]
MRKKGWKQHAGQYVFLQCSELSIFEWHPFTLTTAPEEDYLSVHIRKSGDWTASLLKAVAGHSKDKTTKEGKRAELNFKIAVDGPYGTPSDDIFKYKTTVSIGAGVGVTPYASILKSV